MKPQSKYRKHILVCVREREADSPKGSCSRCGGDQIRKRFADLLKQHGLKSEMRASKTECLDACELGAIVVIYPDDLWYTQVQIEDVDKIFAASVLQEGVYEPRIATAESWELLKQIRAGQVEKPFTTTDEVNAQSFSKDLTQAYEKSSKKDKSYKKHKKDQTKRYTY